MADLTHTALLALTAAGIDATRLAGAQIGCDGLNLLRYANLQPQPQAQGI